MLLLFAGRSSSEIEETEPRNIANGVSNNTDPSPLLTTNNKLIIKSENQLLLFEHSFIGLMLSGTVIALHHGSQNTITCDTESVRMPSSWVISS